MNRTRKAFRRTPRKMRRANRGVSNQLSDPFGSAGTNAVSSRIPPAVSLLGPWRVVPSEVRTILPYVEEMKRAPGTNFDDYKFRINSLHDPDFTSTGHQPLGADQWSNFYDHYRVTKCKVTIMIKNHTSFDAVMAVIVPNLSSLAVPNAEAAAESPYARTAMLGQSTGMDTKTITAIYDLPLLTGRTTSQYRSDDRYQAEFGSSPLQEVILHLFMQNIAGNNLDYSIVVKLEFLVELFDRIQLSTS